MDSNGGNTGSEQGQTWGSPFTTPLLLIHNTDEEIISMSKCLQFTCFNYRWSSEVTALEDRNNHSEGRLQYLKITCSQTFVWQMPSRH